MEGLNLQLRDTSLTPLYCWLRHEELQSEYYFHIGNEFYTTRQLQDNSINYKKCFSSTLHPEEHASVMFQQMYGNPCVYLRPQAIYTKKCSVDIAPSTGMCMKLLAILSSGSELKLDKRTITLEKSHYYAIGQDFARAELEIKSPSLVIVYDVSLHRLATQEAWSSRSCSYDPLQGCDSGRRYFWYCRYDYDHTGTGCENLQYLGQPKTAMLPPFTLKGLDDAVWSSALKKGMQPRLVPILSNKRLAGWKVSPYHDSDKRNFHHTFYTIDANAKFINEPEPSPRPQVTVDRKEVHCSWLAIELGAYLPRYASFAVTESSQGSDGPFNIDEDQSDRDSESAVNGSFEVPNTNSDSDSDSDRTIRIDGSDSYDIDAEIDELRDEQEEHDDQMAAQNEATVQDVYDGEDQPASVPKKRRRLT